MSEPHLHASGDSETKSVWEYVCTSNLLSSIIMCVRHYIIYHDVCAYQGWCLYRVSHRSASIVPDCAAFLTLSLRICCKFAHFLISTIAKEILN